MNKSGGNGDCTIESPVSAGRSSSGGFQAAKEGWLMVLASYPLSGADYAVAIAIAKHLNTRTRNAWPSLETIAKLTNRDHSTVWRSVEKLQKLSLVGVEKRRGRHKSNVYRPLLGDMDLDPKMLRRRSKKNLRNRNMTAKDDAGE